MTHLFCPNCGTNLEPDVPLERGPWRLEVDKAFYNGERCPLTPMQANLLHSLAKVDGRPIKATTLAERISGQDYPSAVTARVVVNAIRRRLGVISPVLNKFGEGYAWQIDTGHSARARAKAPRLSGMRRSGEPSRQELRDWAVGRVRTKDGTGALNPD